MGLVIAIVAGFVFIVGGFSCFATCTSIGIPPIASAAISVLCGVAAGAAVGYMFAQMIFQNA